MTRTYKATGINLKGMPLGETDRLLSILTSEFGLIRAVAPGARKYKSNLRGRTELFVVNELLIVKGRTLDKIIQAETQQSYSKLSKDLAKLAASQYLAELVLCLALSEQPQTELYELLKEHLCRLENLPKDQSIYPSLAQAIFHMLVLAGFGPALESCCFSQEKFLVDFGDPHWRVGFSFALGGVINLEQLKNLEDNETNRVKINGNLTAVELTLLRQLKAKNLPDFHLIMATESKKNHEAQVWSKLERLLRDYTEYHLGRYFRSTTLVDSLST